MGERAALLSFRIATGVILLSAFAAIVIFGAENPLRFIAIGAATTIGIESVIYLITLSAIRSRG